jgi:hypothetical protein
MRPGSSEVYRFRVPCVLTDGHELIVRLRHDNRVTFEGLCDRKEAVAIYKLGGGHTCRQVAALLAQSIKDRFDNAHIRRCPDCAAFVAFPLGWETLWRCPMDRDHRLANADPPWWQRMVRCGRIRQMP